jgi:hypothetical protein
VQRLEGMSSLLTTDLARERLIDIDDPDKGQPGPALKELYKGR